jgi:hypothetical protein
MPASNCAGSCSSASWGRLAASNTLCSASKPQSDGCCGRSRGGAADQFHAHATKQRGTRARACALTCRNAQLLAPTAEPLDNRAAQADGRVELPHRALPTPRRPSGQHGSTTPQTTLHTSPSFAAKLRSSREKKIGKVSHGQSRGKKRAKLINAKRDFERETEK